MSWQPQINWQRGDVVLCDVPMPSTDLRESKIRPAIIISSNRLNQKLNDVMVIPCTSKKKDMSQTHYLITGDEIMAVGIMVESVVLCESIFTLRKTRIIKKLGSLSPETSAKINNCLITALQIR